jgi:hypothetical protein
MSVDYTYDDCLQSGEVRNPMEVEAPPETNEYTNNEIRDSLGADDTQNKNAPAQGKEPDQNSSPENDYDYYNGMGY